MPSGWSWYKTERISPSLATPPSLRLTSPRDSDVCCWRCPSSADQQLKDCRPCCFVPSSGTSLSSTLSQRYEVMLACSGRRNTTQANTSSNCQSERNSWNAISFLRVLLTLWVTFQLGIYGCLFTWYIYIYVYIYTHIYIYTHTHTI